jgi:hypothetical protein
MEVTGTMDMPLEEGDWYRESGILAACSLGRFSALVLRDL